jgi:hypothetical protein
LGSASLAPWPTSINALERFVAITLPRVTQLDILVSATLARWQTITNALKLLLMQILLSCMLEANILGSASLALWPTSFSASPKLSCHKRMLGYMLNLNISKFDSPAL